MRAVAAAAVLVCGCEVLFPLELGPDARAPDAVVDGAGADAGAPDAMLGPFTPGERVTITPAPPNGFYDTDLSLMLDESQLAFARYSTTVADSGDVYLATRAGGPIAWADARVAGFSLSGRTDGTPKLGPDGSAIWLSIAAMGQPADIEAHRRASPASETWSNATASDASGLSSAMDDRPSTPTGDLDRTIVGRQGVLIEYTRLGGIGPWLPAPGGNLDAVNALGIVANPQLSADGTALVFVLTVGGVQNDVHLATRPAPDLPFSPPVPITSINTPANEGDPWLSADRRRLWFSRNGGTLPVAEWGIYYAER